jgi:fibro-slime domain-containing protein
MKAIIAFFLLTFLIGTLGQDSITLDGTLYDFSNGNMPGGHPDFNTFGCGLQKGMVEDYLGDDNLPVLKDKKNCLTSEATFKQWFTEVPGVNEVFPNQITAYWDDAAKGYKFSNVNFFPLDGKGWGYQGMGHNFGFCYKMNSKFTYKPGQKFDFQGDDDVWVFINRKLVIDLGGVHGAAFESVNLDTLELTQGITYGLDLFFCERHQTQSNLIFMTSIELDPCGTTDTDGDGSPDLCDPCPLGDMDLGVWKEDVVGPNNAVIFHIDLYSATQYAYSVSVDFGDGTSQEYDVTPGFVIVHQYQKGGEYTVTYQGAKVSGCGAGPSGSLDVTVGGKRLAPKCSDFSVVPGAPAKRKRSI